MSTRCKNSRASRCNEKAMVPTELVYLFLGIIYSYCELKVKKRERREIEKPKSQLNPFIF